MDFSFGQLQEICTIWTFHAVPGLTLKGKLDSLYLSFKRKANVVIWDRLKKLLGLVFSSYLAILGHVYTEVSNAFFYYFLFSCLFHSCSLSIYGILNILTYPLFRPIVQQIIKRRKRNEIKLIDTGAQNQSFPRNQKSKTRTKSFIFRENWQQWLQSS